MRCSKCNYFLKFFLVSSILYLEELRISEKAIRLLSLGAEEVAKLLYGEL